ncbi:MAG: LytTR family transcriptional regulator [Paludibacteraceae bacterium]|nr:LytTR family transcriptional regulator [Paludibacteraceae bacterium]MBO7316949.1 LytTR family transcriptional regulator [Paludibacteraceae bacterium]
MNHLYIPKYFNEKGNVVRLVLGTAIFALLFINIFQPFNSRDWVPNITEFRYFLFSCLIILTATCVIAISRTVMYFYSKGNEISYLNYAFWVLAELIAMSFFYTLFPYYVLNANVLFWDLFKTAITYTSLIVLAPYSILSLFFSLKDKELRLERIKQQQKEEVPDSNGNLYSFYDEKGTLRLSLFSECLFYIEAADNYVCIYYMNKGKLTSFMLRNSLKNIEHVFSERNLIRCHRSFVVNIANVKIIRKGENGLSIDFDCDGVRSIPISKTFSANVLEQFSAING